MAAGSFALPSWSRDELEVLSEQYGQSPPKNLKVESDPTELGTMRS